MRLLSIVKMTPEMRPVSAKVSFARQRKPRSSERKHLPFQRGKRECWKEAGHRMDTMV
jgi:hypothetical protein